MNIEYIRDWETIQSEPFQQQWLNWVNQAANRHVFFHPALCMAWIETYRPLRKLEPLFCIGRSGEQIIFLPLVLWKRNWKNAFQKLLIPIGYSDFDYHDPLIINSSDSDDETIHEFISQIIETSQFDTFILDGIRGGIKLKDWMNTNTEPCPFIEIKDFDSLDDYLSSLSKNTRKSFKRRFNKLEEDFGKIEFREIIDVNTDEFNNEFEHLMHFHTLRWPKAYHAPKFHFNLLKNGIENKIVFFTLVKVNNQSIAWQVGFMFNNIYYLYIPAIHPDFMSYSPGKISLVFNIENAIKSNCIMVDQLRGDELYKSEWTENYISIRNWEYVPKKISARIKQKLISFK